MKEREREAYNQKKNKKNKKKKKKNNSDEETYRVWTSVARVSRPGSAPGKDNRPTIEPVVLDTTAAAAAEKKKGEGGTSGGVKSSSSKRTIAIGSPAPRERAVAFFQSR